MRYSKRLELFEQLKNKYEGFLTSTLWKLTADAEIFAEAYQYVLLGIWQNIEKLNCPQAGGYIYRIALSANSRAWQNRVGRDGETNLTAEHAEITEINKADEELLSVVRNEISNLPEQQAEAIVMRYIEQMEYKEIADKLNCAEDTARSHVSKAISTLRNNLEDTEYVK